MLTLYIGNKNYSSWSLRAWLLLRQFDIAFEERALMLFTEQFRAEVGKVSAAGRVPVLVDDGFAVWDSLAIAEFVAERYPDKPVWPRDPRERARPVLGPTFARCRPLNGRPRAHCWEAGCGLDKGALIDGSWV